MNKKETFVIAEIGTAHGGSLKKAFELIDLAQNAGADIIKFQWVYADEILHPKTGFVKLPGGNIPLYDRFRQLEVEPDFFRQCMEYSRQKGLLFACSPFGLRSLKELAELEPDAIKIASPEVNHTELLKACAQFYKKIPIILSSGVSKLGDIEKAIDILTQNECENIVQKKNALPPLTLLHCITSYPAPENEYNVMAVKTLSNIFGIPCGISDHSLDPVLVPVLSSAMGGIMVEKHITISKKTDGLDDPVALEGDQFAQMVNAVHQADTVLNRFARDTEAENLAAPENDFSMLTERSVNLRGQQEVLRQMSVQYGSEKVKEVLGSGAKRLAPSEKANYGRTNRSLHYIRDFEKGHKIQAEDIGILRTEKILSPGIAPELLQTVTGAVLQKNVSSGEGVQLKDFFTEGN